ARTNAGDQGVVLILIHAAVPGSVRGAVAPRLLPFDRVLHDIARALGAEHVIGDVVGAAVLLPASTEALDAIGVFVRHRVMIENVAIFRPGAHLPATDAGRL